MFEAISNPPKGKGKEKEMPILQSEAFVDALRAANEELAEKAKGNAGVARAYAAFVEDWCGREIDDNLVRSFLYSLASISWDTDTCDRNSTFIQQTTWTN